MAGFLTRLGAFGIGCTMAVAVYMHSFVRGDPFVNLSGGSSYEPASVFLVITSYSIHYTKLYDVEYDLWGYVPGSHTKKRLDLRDKENDGGGTFLAPPPFRAGIYLLPSLPKEAP